MDTHHDVIIIGRCFPQELHPPIRRYDAKVLMLASPSKSTRPPSWC